MAPFIRRTIVAVSLLFIANAAASSANAQMEIKPTHPNGEVSLVVDFEVKGGSEAEFENAFKRSVKCSRSEPGNVAFDVGKVVGMERRYVLYEVWRSVEALKLNRPGFSGGSLV